MASTVLPNGIIIPEKFSRDWYSDLYHNWEELDNLLGGGTPKDGTLTIQKNGSTVGTFSANQATDETVNITVPDVNNGTLTIQQNGTTVDTFTANSSSDKTVNITVPDVNNGTLTIQKNGTTIDTFTANSSTDKTVDITVPTKTSDLTNDSGFITEDNTKIPLAGSNAISGSLIPATTDAYDLGAYSYQWNKAYIKSLTISGGVVLADSGFSRAVDNRELEFRAGPNWNTGGAILMFGKNHPALPGRVQLHPSDGPNEKDMFLYPDGTWTWSGQAVQLVSDQRLKQQIDQIDDKLLDAWEDVDLVQFKYNDAVDEKGKDKARLHTGYVVQQIDNACKSHGVDVSQYGLYCHEEYPQETEEIEVEQADGTKTKERKVIREANEHYSLRYTEALIVECKYLRRCIARLTARIEELEKGSNTK